MNSVVIAFGRFNPPTKGHEELISSYMMPYAKQKNAECILFLSHTNDKNNPLTYKEKVNIFTKQFPALTIGSNKVHTLYDALNSLVPKYNKIILFCGEDRKADFSSMIDSWKETHPNITVRVISTPRQESNISSSLLKKAALNNNKDEVRRLSMPNINPTWLMQTIKDRSTVTEGNMNIKSFRSWLITEADEPNKKFEPLDEPSSKTSDDKDKEPSPDETKDDDKEEPENITPAPKPNKPLPPDAPEDDGRVPSDTPENQSKLVMYPKVRMKYDMKSRANRPKEKHLNMKGNTGAANYI